MDLNVGELQQSGELGLPVYHAFRYLVEVTVHTLFVPVQWVVQVVASGSGEGGEVGGQGTT